MSLIFRITIVLILAIAGGGYWLVTHLCVDNANDAAFATAVAAFVKARYEEGPSSTASIKPRVKLLYGWSCRGQVALTAYQATGQDIDTRFRNASREALTAFPEIKDLKFRRFEGLHYDQLPSGGSLKAPSPLLDSFELERQ